MVFGAASCFMRSFLYWATSSGEMSERSRILKFAFKWPTLMDSMTCILGDQSGFFDKRYFSAATENNGTRSLLCDRPALANLTSYFRFISTARASPFFAIPVDPQIRAP